MWTDTELQWFAEAIQRFGYSDSTWRLVLFPDGMVRAYSFRSDPPDAYHVLRPDLPAGHHVFREEDFR